MSQSASSAPSARWPLTRALMALGELSAYARDTGYSPNRAYHSSVRLVIRRADGAEAYPRDVDTTWISHLSTMVPKPTSPMWLELSFEELSDEDRDYIERALSEATQP